MSLPRFDFAAPRTLAEAVSQLSRPGARVLGGGTDLLPRLERRQVQAKLLVSLRHIEELRGISCDPHGALTIGAAARLADVLAHAGVRQHWPALAEAISAMATPQIRNMGTLAGNICNGSPCADSVPVLMSAGARVELNGPAGAREVRLDGFFRGPGAVALEPGELVVRVHVPPPPPHAGFAFRKLPARTAVDVSAVNVGAMVRGAGGRCDEACLVLGAVAPVPMRAGRAESLLAGRALAEELLAEAGAIAAEETRPIDDVRASATYRRAMVAVLARRALAAAARRAGLPVAGGGRS